MYKNCLYLKIPNASRPISDLVFNGRINNRKLENVQIWHGLRHYTEGIINNTELRRRKKVKTELFQSEDEIDNTEIK